MPGHYCIDCAFFSCEMMTTDGRPLLDYGYCPKRRKNVDADDFCNQFKIANWKKRPVEKSWLEDGE